MPGAEAVEQRRHAPPLRIERDPSSLNTAICMLANGITQCLRLVTRNRLGLPVGKSPHAASTVSPVQGTRGPMLGMTSGWLALPYPLGLDTLRYTGQTSRPTSSANYIAPEDSSRLWGIEGLWDPRSPLFNPAQELEVELAFVDAEKRPTLLSVCEIINVVLEALNGFTFGVGRNPSR